MIMALQQTEKTAEFTQFPLCPDKWVELPHKEGERFAVEPCHCMIFSKVFPLRHKSLSFSFKTATTTNKQKRKNPTNKQKSKNKQQKTPPNKKKEVFFLKIHFSRSKQDCIGIQATYLCKQDNRFPGQARSFKEFLG